ncbi:MAG: hypothetical protein INQ03_01240 [Candidatus Heimdallarchaeota archaeon]|nr:hypothetical protein [Candidatus Heimdallarchaeota archaeon]
MPIDVTHIPFLGDRRKVILILLFTLLVAIAIGSLSNSNPSSSVDPFVFYISLIAFSYIAIISLLRASGADPNKFEMTIIPAFFIIILVITLSIFEGMASNEPEPNNGTIISEHTLAETSISNTTINTGNGDPTITESMVQDAASSGLPPMVLAIILGLMFIALSIVIIYFLSGKDRMLPNIQFAKEVEYHKNLPATNKKIMEYYVDASLALEKLKGKAPEWFSPTKFAGKIILNPGPPVAGYFSILTSMYEKARFSSVEITSDDVLEAHELHGQIMVWVEMQMEERE